MRERGLCGAEGVGMKAEHLVKLNTSIGMVTADSWLDLWIAADSAWS